MKTQKILKYLILVVALAVFCLPTVHARGGQLAGGTESTTVDEIITDIPKSISNGLYDETVLRTISLEFAQEDWWEQLVQNHDEEEDENLLADLTMDGITYPGVGVKFRGATSYNIGDSKKKSFNIAINETYPKQRLMGYKTLNLNNAHVDPSFIHEVLYFNIFRKYAPCPQANFVKLIINGENWGIYINVQQINSDLIKEWFQSSNGDRWKVGTGTLQNETIHDDNTHQLSYNVWLSTPMAQDYNGDGQITEDDFIFLINSILQLSFTDWSASFMAQDYDDDGQITEADFEIFSNFINSVQQHIDSNLVGNPNIFYDHNLFGDPSIFVNFQEIFLEMMGLGNTDTYGSGDGALVWLGSDIAEYEEVYELKTAKTPDPWENLIAICDILNNTSLDQLEDTLDTVLAVDRWLWFLAMENIFTDRDSYLTKGGDYQIYYEVETGRIHILQHDGNETFDTHFVHQSPFEGEEDPARPLINRILAVSAFRERYLAHMRTIIEKSLDWDVLESQIEAYRALIADEVKADTKKLYSYAKFEESFIDIENFINGRRDYLLNHPEINRPTPQISSVVRELMQGYSSTPLPEEPVLITADVEGEVGIEQVILYYANGAVGPFNQVPMLYDYVNGNGEITDNIFIGEIPAFPVGSLIRYYVEVRSSDAGGSTSFAPSGAEHQVFTYKVLITTVDSTTIVINELMADNEMTIQDPQGEFDDWIELLNISNQEIDLSGMYLSDREDNPLKWEIPSGTTLAPGAYLIIWADEDGSDQPGLHANFKLSASGETVILVDKDEQMNAILDSVLFGEQEADVSFGRFPDGAGQFQVLSAPSPESDNLSSDCSIPDNKNSDEDGDGYTTGQSGYYYETKIWNQFGNSLWTRAGVKSSLYPVLYAGLCKTLYQNPFFWNHHSNNSWARAEISTPLFQILYPSPRGIPYQNPFWKQLGSSLWTGTGVSNYDPLIVLYSQKVNK